MKGAVKLNSSVGNAMLYVLLFSAFISVSAGTGMYWAGKLVGRAECNAVQLDKAMRQAARDTDARDAIDKSNTEEAITEGKVEAANDDVSRSIEDTITSDGSDNDCTSARFLRDLAGIK